MTAPLVARTRRVTGDLDLVERAGRDGVLFERSPGGFAGRGVALRTTVASAAEELSAIEVEDEVERPGTGPVAFGALPFVPDPNAPFVVPEQIWGRADDGTQWLTTVSAAGTPLGEDGGDPEPPPPPGELRVAPERSARWWCDLVAEATEAMATAGPDGLRKVVLAREVVVEADEPFDRAAVLRRLRRTFPGCFTFHVDGFLGASPELLVARARRGGAGPADGGHRPEGRRPGGRRGAGRGAAGVEHVPARAPDHHRHGVRHAPAVVLVPRLRTRAIGGRRRQRAAPRHARRRPALPTGAVDPRARGRPPPHTCGQRLAPRPGRPSGSPSTRGSTAVATAAPSAGSTPAATAPSPSASAAPTWRAEGPGWSQATASSPPPTPGAELEETQQKLQALLTALIRL